MNKKKSEKPENKKPVTFKLYQKTIDRLEKASEKSGLKKNTIFEQGLEKRLRELGE
jgi:hypothetical protein